LVRVITNFFRFAKMCLCQVSRQGVAWDTWRLLLLLVYMDGEGGGTFLFM
jgi:hypothetical protein